MNTLEIVQATRLASGVQGEIDSVVSQTGIKKTIISFVNSAYNDIQLLREDWSWRQTGGSFNWTTTSTSEVLSGVGKLNLLYYDQKPLIFVEYEQWLLNEPYDSYLYPYIFTIQPETRGIIINPVDATYGVYYRGVKSPETLTTNSQIPLLPPDHHNIIVYKAAKDIGLFLGNAEIMNLNAERYDTAIGALLRAHNLPKRIRQRPIV
jgi:hypothetical protein